MQKKTIEEINQIYELELDKILNTIKQKKAKRILLQFPEGMKPFSQVICDFIENKADCNCFIWMGSCYGACDVPNDSNLEKDVDLIIQFGHSAWKNNSKGVELL